jgi:superfamily I DNA/RNA helicase
MTPRGGYREGAGRRKSDRPTTAVRIDTEIAEKVKALLEEMTPTEILFRLEINHDQQREAFEELGMMNQKLMAEIEQLRAKLAAMEAVAIANPEPEPELEPEDDGSGLSIYQKKILAAIRDRLPQKQKKGLLVEALAGCGKSFTLGEIGKVLRDEGVRPSECRFVVFGKKNQLDLQGKMKSEVGVEWGSSVSTLHSLGRSILASQLRLDVKGWKYSDIAKKNQFIAYHEYGTRVTGELGRGENPAIESDHAFLDLLEKLRLYCLDATEENVRFLACKHHIGIPNHGLKAVTDAADKCLSEGIKQGLAGRIDFTDMSWLVWKCRDLFSGSIASVRESLRFVAVDECQDTDQLQIEVLSLLVDPAKSFLCCVGDRYQAVYNFRGCLADGLNRMKEKFDCEALPLPINYRCGKNHLSFVRELFPYIQIQPHQDAPEGEIRCIRESDFLSIFDDPEGDYFGICRRNAPLLKYAIWLLSNQIPAKIKDKSLGDKLVKMVAQISPKYHPETFPEAIAAYEISERLRFERYPDSEQRISDLQDKMEAISALFDAYTPPTLEDWEKVINRIFEESDRHAVNLYTVHSGKGGEGENTFILAPHSMPLRHKKQSSEELDQEWNLLYVSLTRAKQILWLVIENDDKGEPRWPEWLPGRMEKFWEKDEPDYGF